MNSGTGLNILQKAEPEHYFDVGIAEQQAVLFAAGLALEGAKPVCAIYSTFLQRAFDQIVHDVCLQKLNVVFAMDRAGLVGDDGPTHHGVFDIAYLRCLPNIVLMAPRDEAHARAHAAHRADLRRRPDRAALPARRGRRRPAAAERSRRSRSARGEILREGDAGRDRRLRQRRAEGARGGRPARRGRPRGHRRRRALRQAARRAACSAQLAAEHELLVTVEEGVLAGGFGSAVWEALNDAGGHVPRILRVGLPDRYVTHGKPALLHAEVGFTGKAIAAAHRGRHRGRRRARSPARERGPAPAGPRAHRERPRRRPASPGRPTSRPSAPPTCRPRSSSAARSRRSRGSRTS